MLALAIGLFAWHASTNQFLQDDSYITYRYARNVDRGLGPVFNPGERVEGYTNFLWMMLLSVLGIVGLPFSTIIPLSQVLGVLCGAVTILIFFLILRRHSRGPPELAGFGALLLAANGAFAYWNVSGMETGMFTMLVAAAVLFWFEPETPRNLLTSSALLGLAGLTRPEGALFAGVFGLHFIIRHLASRDLFSSRVLKRLGLFALPFLALVVPLYAWRISYYGHFFPNTFYAKTGASAAYVKAGIDYLVDFHQAYGLWGVAFVGAVGLALWRGRLRPGSPLFFCVLALVVHTAYVVWVGGDVLRLYRFFVPVLVLFYLLVYEGFWLLPFPRTASFLLLLALLPVTFIGPLRVGRTVAQEVARNQYLENGLVDKMRATGQWLNRHLAEDEWFGCTTIGAVSWFADRPMVDLLGLTDPVIAHDPENILPVDWHWKERNYNTRHVLELEPKYIYFSTGIKPSAEAERALFLRPRFRRGYFACPITITIPSGPGTEVIYKARPGSDTIPLEPLPEHPRFINHYLEAINAIRTPGADSAIRAFRRCVAEAPPDFGYAHEWLGQLYAAAKNEERSIAAYREAVQRDDWCITSHSMLGSWFAGRNELDSAVAHLDKVVSYAPDYYAGYANYSSVLSKARRFTEAEQVLLKARELWPDLPDAALRHAYLYYESGDLDRAVQVLEQFLEMKPGEPTARKMLDDIRRLRQSRPQTPPPGK
jgi:tetratricopeptide (TPR) repeat protein